MMRQSPPSLPTGRPRPAGVAGARGREQDCEVRDPAGWCRRQPDHLSDLGRSPLRYCDFGGRDDDLECLRPAGGEFVKPLPLLERPVHWNGLRRASGILTRERIPPIARLVQADLLRAVPVTGGDVDVASPGIELPADRLFAVRRPDGEPDGVSFGGDHRPTLSRKCPRSALAPPGRSPLAKTGPRGRGRSGGAALGRRAKTTPRIP